MHEKKKLEEVIARRRKMIEESEKIMEQILLVHGKCI